MNISEMTDMLGKEERRLVELIERLMVRWGYKQIEGKIYGLLLVSRDPLTIADLVRLTGMSRTSISVSLSKLERDYLVTYTKNGRTKLFSPIPAFVDKFMEQPKILLEREIRPASELLSSIIEKAGDQGYRSKLRRIKESLDELGSLLEEIISFEADLRRRGRGAGSP